MAGIDFAQLFDPQIAPLETVLRGTVIYLGLLVLLRVLRRPAGQLSLADMLLITVLADASQNAMGGGDESLVSGLLLVGTIVFWDQVVDWFAYRSRRFGQLVEPPPVALIRDGQIQWPALRTHRLGEDELMSHLRAAGLDEPAQVRRCFLEGDGSISVLKKSDG